MPNIQIIIPKEGESVDTPKKFKNIDDEVFECTWDGIVHTVKPGESVIKPLYLVNYMAMHLARKIVKREMVKAIPVAKRQSGLYRVRDEKKEKELQEQMVAENEQPKTEEKVLEEKPKK